MAALTASAALPVAGRAATALAGQRLRVTVLRRECYDDLQSRYLCDPEEGPCSRFVTGQTFTVTVGKCPEGICPRAWHAIEAAVESGRACATGADNALVVGCPDGTRPVIFRVEFL